MDSTGELVLTGGQDASGHLSIAHQWVWDGTDWRARYVPAPPPGSGRTTPDPFGRGIITVGPLATSLCDGNSWQALASAPALPQIMDPYLVTDPLRGEVVVMGSDNYGFVTYRYRAASDTWTTQFEDQASLGRAALPGFYYPPTRSVWCFAEYDHRSGIGIADWTNAGFRRIPFPGSLITDANPANVVAGYHEGSGLVLAMSSLSTSGRREWISDGSTWQSRSYSNGPGSFSIGNARVMEDPARNRLLYWSGTEIWAWQPPAQWTLLFNGDVLHGNGPYGIPAMFDPVRNTLVFVGSRDSANQLVQHWEYDVGLGQMRRVNPGPLTPLPSPPSGSMVWAPAFGGAIWVSPHSGLNGAQRWDGNAWHLIQTLDPPPSPGTNSTLYGGAAIYDASRGRILVSLLGDYRDVFWELALDRFTVTPSVARTGDVVRFDPDLPAEAGRIWLLALSLGNDGGVPIGPGTEVLPLDPDPLLSASLGSWMGGRLDSQGRGHFALRVPLQPAFAGLRIWSAVIAIDNGPSITAVTEAEEFRTYR
ncbi:MAG: hypothetical protein U1F36_09380 [Planctomycetota bacterium]